MTLLDPALLDRVRRRVAASGSPVTSAAVAAALREEGGALRGDAELLPVLRLLQSEIVGAGPLEPLLRDPDVTDVLVNAPDEVWVDRGGGLERVAVRFPDDLSVRRLAQRLAAPSGRRLDDAQPWVDARLADGVRLHAVLPPVAPAGTCLSLRVPRARVFTLDELVAAGSLPPDGAALLARVVASRAAFLVSGGTGTRYEQATLSNHTAREAEHVTEEGPQGRHLHPDQREPRGVRVAGPAGRVGPRLRGVEGLGGRRRLQGRRC